MWLPTPLGNRTTIFGLWPVLGYGPRGDRAGITPISERRGGRGRRLGNRTNNRTHSGCGLCWVTARGVIGPGSPRFFLVLPFFGGRPQRPRDGVFGGRTHAFYLFPVDWFCLLLTGLPGIVA
jgi:hypothetical protein